MIPTGTILLILAAHYIGDWVLQVYFKKWMGQKHKNWLHLGTHVAVLAIPLVIISPLWGAINALSHGVVDAVTSRMTNRLYRQKRFSSFFMVIGTDQFIHLALLFGTWEWLA